MSKCSVIKPQIGSVLDSETWGGGNENNSQREREKRGK